MNHDLDTATINTATDSAPATAAIFAPTDVGDGQSQGIEASVEEFVVKVVTDGQGGATFTYNGMETLLIEVPAFTTKEIRFRLELESGSFVTNPFSWFSNPPKEGGQPTLVPQSIQENWEDFRVATLLDVNVAPGTFHVTLTVLLDGVIYTSPDPTIINHPDGPRLP